MIRITYTQGNGYKCGCCRRTEQDYIEFETEDEAMEWLSEKEAWKKHPSKNGRWIFPPDDFEIDNIVETKEIFLAANPVKVQELVVARMAEEAAEKATEAVKAKERDKLMYEALKAVADAGGFEDKGTETKPEERSCRQ